VSFAAITLCVASQRVFIVVVYFVIDSVRKLLDTPSYTVTSSLLYRSYSVFIQRYVVVFNFPIALRYGLDDRQFESR
jgi:hypothetical protein